MKPSLSVLLATIIVVVLLGFEYWQYRDQQAYRQASSAQLTHLLERVNHIEERIQIAKIELDEIQQNSLGGLIETANDALIEGWSAMINSVQKELERAKKEIATPPQSIQPKPHTSNPTPKSDASPL